LLTRTIRLLVEVHQEQRHGFNSLRTEMQQLSARLENVEALLARRSQPVAPAAPLPDLPELPATSLVELEAAEAALQLKDMVSALVFSCYADVISRKAGVGMAAVEGFIKKWLPGSADRGGGRKTRFEQSLAHQPLSLATRSTPARSEP
ncbi:hypothetical protein MTO96_039928, partial [Rhipicephalus appendiculatus]